MTRLPFEFKPDAAASSPLYLQLAQTLSRAITDGLYNRKSVV